MKGLSSEIKKSGGLFYKKCCRKKQAYDLLTDGLVTITNGGSFLENGKLVTVRICLLTTKFKELAENKTIYPPLDDNAY